MATDQLTFGLTLANRGVLLGVTTPADLRYPLRNPLVFAYEWASLE